MLFLHRRTGGGVAIFRFGNETRSLHEISLWPISTKELYQFLKTEYHDNIDSRILDSEVVVFYSHVLQGRKKELTCKLKIPPSRNNNTKKKGHAISNHIIPHISQVMPPFANLLATAKTSLNTQNAKGKRKKKKDSCPTPKQKKRSLQYIYRSPKTQVKSSHHPPSRAHTVRTLSKPSP